MRREKKSAEEVKQEQELLLPRLSIKQINHMAIKIGCLSPCLLHTFHLFTQQIFIEYQLNIRLGNSLEFMVLAGTEENG